MATSPAPLIIGGAAILALLLSAGEGSKDRPPVNGKRDPVGPIPVPQTDEDLLLVDQTICDCWEALGKADDLAKIRACVGETLHPDVPFPPIAADHTTVKAVWDLFTQRTQAFLAEADKQGWCDNLEEKIDPLDVLQEWISDEAIPGKFYIVGTDPEKGGSDSLAGITRRALNRTVAGGGNDGGRRIDYMHCITSGPKWNWPLYASSSFSDAFPQWAGVNGMGLRRAFFAWHDDAKKAIMERRMPTRAITQNGSRIPGVGNKYAMLWLPPVDPAALAEGVVTCGSVEWNDGSSSIDPPPELLNMLNGGA
jgi:hypothetical protein